MTDDHKHRNVSSEKGGQPPVPPVEGAWLEMRKKLDAEMSVSRWQHLWNRLIATVSPIPHSIPWSGWATAAIAWMGLAGAIVFLLLFHKPGLQKTAILPHDSLDAQKSLLSPKADSLDKHAIPNSILHRDIIASEKKLKAGDSLLNATRIGRAPSTVNEVKNSDRRPQNASKTGGNGTLADLDFKNAGSASGRAERKKGDSDLDNQPQVTGRRQTGPRQVAVDPTIADSDQLSDEMVVLGDSMIKRSAASKPSLLKAGGMNNLRSAVRESRKSVQNGITGQGEHSMAAGIEIKKYFPFGSQMHSSYNINAKENLLSDYIPGVYFRYNLSNRIYLQAAFHISSPQYCRSSEIDSRTDSLTFTTNVYTTRTTTLTLEKLYYADIPVTFHFRVFKCFSFGAGLQFSMLRNGVGMEETKLNGYGSIPDSIISNLPVSLRDHSDAYSHLNKIDWRLLLDLGYQYKRFGFGVRYQQGLASYLKGSQTIQGGKKNSALGVYVQMDLWRKK
jgi:hypothetical protein